MKQDIAEFYRLHSELSRIFLMLWTNIGIVEREKITEIAENRYCSSKSDEKIRKNIQRGILPKFTNIVDGQMIGLSDGKKKLTTRTMNSRQTG